MIRAVLIFLIIWGVPLLIAYVSSRPFTFRVPLPRRGCIDVRSRNSELLLGIQRTDDRFTLTTIGYYRIRPRREARGKHQPRRVSKPTSQ
jgi:hypothetical protein